MGSCRSKQADDTVGDLEDKNEYDEDEDLEAAFEQAENLKAGIVPTSEETLLQRYHRPRVFVQNWTSRIAVHMRLLLSKNRYKVDDYFFIVVYWKKLRGTNWIQSKQTDHVRCDSTRPHELIFNKSVSLQFHMQEVIFLRFEVYKLKNKNDATNLRKQKFIGCATTTLIEVMLKRAKKPGWHTLNLEHPTIGNYQGVLGCYAIEESFYKQNISFELHCDSLKPTDLWKRHNDAYVRVFREVAGSEDGKVDVEAIARTEVKCKTNKPSFERVEFNTATGFSRGINRGILLEVVDWNRVYSHNPVGEAWLDYKSLLNKFRASEHYSLDLYARPSRGRHLPRLDCIKTRIKNKSKDAEAGYTGTVGSISLKKINVQRAYSFMDYIKGGMELKLLMAFDFSRSAKSTETEIDLREQEEACKNVIQIIGEIMQKYDSDDAYPVYGTGALIPPRYSTAQDMFALTGDYFKPEVDSIDGILHAYKQALRIVKKHGPTRLSVVVRQAVELCMPYANVTDPKTELCFSALVIVTDGDVPMDDQNALVDALVAAASVPLMVIILGINCAPDIAFIRNIRPKVENELRKKGHTHEMLRYRTVVRWADLDDRKGDGPLKNELKTREHAQDVLSDIPSEILGFFANSGAPPRGLDEREETIGETRDPTPPPGSMMTLNDFRQRQKKQQADDKARFNEILGQDSLEESMSRSQSLEGMSRSQSLDAMSRSQTLEQDEVPQHHFVAMDQLLAQMKEKLKQKAKKLGYSRPDIERGLTLGCASFSIDYLLETLSCMDPLSKHTNTYKVAYETVHLIEDEEDPIVGFEVPDETTLLLREIRHLLCCDRLSLFVSDPQSKKLRPYAEKLEDLCLAAVAFQENKKVAIQNCYDDYRFDKAVDTKTGYRTLSLIAVPIPGQSGPLGVIQAINKLPKRLSEDSGPRYKQAMKFPRSDELVVELVAEEIGKLFHRGTLDLKATMDSIQTFHTEVTKHRDLQCMEKIWTLSKGLASDIFQCDRVSIYLYDKENNDHLPYASFDSRASDTSIQLQGVAKLCWSFLDDIIIDQAETDHRFDRAEDRKARYHTISVVAMPIFESNGEAVGIIEAVNKFNEIRPICPETGLPAIEPFKRHELDLVKWATCVLSPYVEKFQLSHQDVDDIMWRMQRMKIKMKWVTHEEMIKIKNRATGQVKKPEAPRPEGELSNPPVPSKPSPPLPESPPRSWQPSYGSPRGSPRPPASPLPLRMAGLVAAGAKHGPPEIDTPFSPEGAPAVL